MSKLSKSKFQPKTVAEAPRVFSLSDSIFSMEDAARFLRIGRSLMFEIVARGDVRTFKVGRRSLIRGRELKTYIDGLASSE